MQINFIEILTSNKLSETKKQELYIAFNKRTEKKEHARSIKWIKENNAFENQKKTVNLWNNYGRPKCKDFM